MEGLVLKRRRRLVNEDSNYLKNVAIKYRVAGL
jgi:hypothetical protein